MSKNKYKNNDPLNQKNAQISDESLAKAEPLPKSQNETHFGPDEQVRQVEIEEDPILLSEWADPQTEVPKPPLEHPTISMPLDYREHGSLTEPVAIDFTADNQIPSEKNHYSEEVYPKSVTSKEHQPQQSKNIEDGSDSIDSKYYSQPIDPYTGDKIFQEEVAEVRDRMDLNPGEEGSARDVRTFPDRISQREPIDPRDIPADPTIRPAQTSRDSSPKDNKGFPWWWILLPLILLAIIYGLSRPATTPGTTPSNTTSYLPLVENRIAMSLMPEAMDRFQW